MTVLSSCLAILSSRLLGLEKHHLGVGSKLEYKRDQKETGDKLS